MKSSEKRDFHNSARLDRSSSSRVPGLRAAQQRRGVDLVSNLGDGSETDEWREGNAPCDARRAID